jgi:hypothetical protein
VETSQIGHRFFANHSRTSPKRKTSDPKCGSINGISQMDQTWINSQETPILDFGVP